MRAVGVLLLVCIVAWTAAAADKQPLTDDMIYDRVIRALANDRELKTTAIEVEVKEGVVTLRGVMESEKLRRRAERVAGKVSGVKKVINELRVRS